MFHCTKMALNLSIIFSLIFVTSCTAVDKIRKANDVAIANYHHFSVEALVQAEIQRQRLRKFRCYSPLMYPAALVAAATDNRLGDEWLDELFRDCPQFAFLISNLVVKQAEGVAISVTSEK